MTETWLPVVGYEGRYEVSSLGRVRSRLRDPQGRVMALVDYEGYKRVTLCADGHLKTPQVHRLVVDALLLPPLPGQVEIRHLDGNPSNNAAANLAWGTHSENVEDTVRHGTHHEARKTHCKNGHEFSEQNTRHSRGQRVCIACERRRVLCPDCDLEVSNKALRRHAKRRHGASPAERGGIVSAVERAARDLYYEEANDSDGFDAWPEWESHDNPTRDIWRQRVRSALTAALDVDELARVLHDAACTCDGTTHTPQWWENCERSARAVVAHLTKGGDENDE